MTRLTTSITGKEEAGAYIRSLRLKAGLTHCKLAQRTDIGYYTKLSAIERGKMRLSPEHLGLMSSALEVETTAFAKRLLFHYEPEWFAALFPTEYATFLTQEELE